MKVRLFNKVLCAAILLFGISFAVTAKDAAEGQTKPDSSASDSECNLLKKKIQEAKEYSATMYHLLEKHYSLLLKRKEKIDNYLSFYRGLSEKTSDPVLKTAFLQRKVKGLLLMHSQDAKKEFQRIKRDTLQNCIFEQGYYKYLQTYFLSADASSEEKYQESIQFYEKNHLSEFEISELYYNFAWYYLNLKNNKKVLLYFQKVLKIRQKLFGEVHPDIAKSLNNIGNAYSLLGEYTKALSYHQQALEMKRKLYGETHPDIAKSLNNIGNVYFNLGEYAKTLSYYQQTLAMQRKFYKGIHPNIANSLYNIGNAYKSLGKYARALSYYQQALTMRQKLYGEIHPDIADSLYSNGILYCSFGEYVKALSYHKQALIIERKLYGETHPDIAKSLSGIGNVYFYLGEYIKALSYHQQSLVMERKLYGETHPEIAKSLNNIGNVYFNLGEYAKALSYHQQALVMQRKFYKETHPDIADCLSGIGNVYFYLGEYTKALSYHQQALVMQRKFYKETHPDIANSLNNIGVAYSVLGEYTKALSYYQQALVMQRKLYGETHPDIAKSLYNIGNVYFYLGNLPEAKRYRAMAEQTPISKSLDKLWKYRQGTKQKTSSVKDYCDVIRSSLKHLKYKDAMLAAKELKRLCSSTDDLDSLIAKGLDEIKCGLDHQTKTDEYFLFLKIFTDSGFSDFLPEQNKKYFGDLEGYLFLYDSMPYTKIHALKLLALNCMRSESSFEDGLEKMYQACELAQKVGNYVEVLSLYRETLGQMNQFHRNEFLQVYAKTVAFATKLKAQNFLDIFILQKELYQWYETRDIKRISVILEMVKKNPYAGSMEVFRILNNNPKILNSGTPDVIALLEMISPQFIKTLSGNQRKQAASILEYAGKHTSAKRWFQFRLMSIDQLLYLAASVSSDDFSTMQEKKKILLRLVPEPFKMEGQNYSAEDFDLLLSVTKFQYAKLTVDDSLLATSACHAEELLQSGKCDQTFVQVLKTEINTTLCDHFYSSGRPEDALKYADRLLENSSKTDVMYPRYLTRKGLCSLAMGKNKEAADLFLEAGNLFMTKQKRMEAATVFRNQACALYRYAFSLSERDPQRSKTFEASLAAMRRCCAVGYDPKEKSRFNQEEADWVLLPELACIKGTRKQKEEAYHQLRKRADRSASSIVRCDFLMAAILFQRDVVRNVDQKIFITDLEKYFQYKDSITTQDWLRTPTFFPEGERIARKFLLSALRKQKNAVRLDYWNKRFEYTRVKHVDVSDDYKADGTRLTEISLMEIVSQFQAAEAVVKNEEQKPEKERDQKLLQSARRTKLRLENIFESKKLLLTKNKKLQFEKIAADSFVIPPDALNQFSSVLEDKTVCIQFIPLEDEIFVCLASRSTPPIIHTIPLKKYGMTQKQFRRNLIQIRSRLQNNSISEQKIKKDLNQFYSLLFSDIIPILEKIKAQKLVINSIGSLRYIPFAALHNGKQYLVEKYQITNVTGLDMIRLSKEKASRKIQNITAVIFANPDGTLPLAQKEGETIAALFNNKKIFVGKSASLQTLESLAGKINFLHFSTHGVLDTNHPRHSYILLADGKKWRYSDMMGFNIHDVDSIALSACETAVSEKSTGGEIEGMAYQLLKKSPSGSVLASFWKVDDTATAMLMGIYYKHVTDSIKTNHTLDRGGALREAQLNLLKNPNTSHPYYWAAFALFGDFR